MTPSAARRGARERLDVLIARKGLARSRRAAQALIMSGRVRVEGRRVDKPGTPCDTEALIEIDAPDRAFVSRGGEKLSGALDAFAIDPRDAVAIDVGASTGGFTECLLIRGARRVVALDVGRGQLDWSLRRHPRVDVLEGINARFLVPSMLPEGTVPFDLAVIDVSFISLRLVLPPVAAVVRDAPGTPGRIVALVKPQFEAGPDRVGRGGIVRDPAVRRETIVDVARAADAAGLRVLGLAPSVLRGAEGNREYFLHLARGAGASRREEIENDAFAITQREED